jgi:serine/threonine protein kinase
LRWNEGDTRERDALQLIAESKQSHLIKLLCWYRYENYVNYVFEHYRGPLEHILNGTMKEPSSTQQPARYHGSRLQHWLWQGVVDAISALAFFHTPVTPHVRLGEMSAAHCDLKPANILVDDTGNLIVTDFGHAQLIQRSQRGSNTLADLGDINYQPPAPSTSNQGPRSDTSDPTWLQACDVWSVACVLMEVIEYIKSRDGPDRVKQFRANRENDNRSNRAFWIATPGGYDIRKSVRSTLQSFRSTQDQYLNSVTDLLEQMLSIDPSNRPTMAQCHAIISQNVPTDEWPLLDNGEVSISGLGASTLLRNM